ncbi:c-type cytochrome [Roseibium sp. Sym1]|uniref:c-type cytochrome n=1 Tax=Roseibium sp. Sym1 TaxID=3016006 RepID=UPI0022B5D734|nr:cytochrome c [Roseibium sp. Sym1]
MLKLLLTVAFCLLAITSLALAAESSPPQVLVSLVHQDCGSCHGMTLKGGLGPDIRPEALAHYDVDTLSTVVLDGIPKTAMPPWRPLISEADARRIAEYLLKGDIK